MGSYIGKNSSGLYRIISIDASKLENGFIINEYQNFDLLSDSWKRIIGDIIQSDNEKFIFNREMEI
jgi:hypothetical protein